MSAEVELRIPRGVTYAVRFTEARKDVTPSEGQYRLLLMLGAGGQVGASWREVEPLLRREWVSGKRAEQGFTRVRITPDGLRALALAVERYGLPSLERDAA